MSDPGKAWTLLTARGMSFSGVGRGGTSGLTPSEVARMLHGLKRGPFLMGMARECSAMEVLGELEYCMWTFARDLAEGLRENLDGKLERIPNYRVWPLNGKAYCRRLAGLAIYECLLQRPIRCARCVGRGFTVVQGQAINCEKCNNSGGEPLAAKQRADLVGIPWESWRSGWNWRYEEVLAEANGWHGDAMRHMALALDRSRDFAEAC